MGRVIEPPPGFWGSKAKPLVAVSGGRALALSAEMRENRTYKGLHLTLDHGQLMWGQHLVCTFDPYQVQGQSRHHKPTVSDVRAHVKRHCEYHGKAFAMPWMVEELTEYTCLVPVSYRHKSVCFFGDMADNPNCIGVILTYFAPRQYEVKWLLKPNLEDSWPVGAIVATLQGS